MINTSMTMTGLLALNSQQPTPNQDFNNQCQQFRTTASLFAPDHNAKMTCISTSYKRMVRESYSHTFKNQFQYGGETEVPDHQQPNMRIRCSFGLPEKQRKAIGKRNCGWVEDRVLGTWSIHWIWQMQTEKGSPTESRKVLVWCLLLGDGVNAKYI